MIMPMVIHAAPGGVPFACGETRSGISPLQGCLQRSIGIPQMRGRAWLALYKSMTATDHACTQWHADQYVNNCETESSDAHEILYVDILLFGRHACLRRAFEELCIVHGRPNQTKAHVSPNMCHLFHAFWPMHMNPISLYPPSF